jgi:hypothetical protein
LSTIARLLCRCFGNAQPEHRVPALDLFGKPRRVAAVLATRREQVRFT